MAEIAEVSQKHCKRLDKTSLQRQTLYKDEGDYSDLEPSDRAKKKHRIMVSIEDFMDEKRRMADLDWLGMEGEI